MISILTGSNLQRDVELYFTEYENRTPQMQSYTFETSRETTATTKIELQENYTIGAEANLEVGLVIIRLISYSFEYLYVHVCSKNLVI